MQFARDQTLSVRPIKFLSLAAVPSLCGLSIASLPLPAVAQDNVIATATLPRDLSPWGMFVSADSVVKAVLIGLTFASVLTWTVWLAKTIEIVICKRRVRAALNILAGVRSTSEGVERLGDTKGEVRQFLDAAVTELKLSGGSVERKVSRNGSYHASSALKRPMDVASCAGLGCSRRSVRPLRSLACSEPSGGS
jgi:hypothetical protein